MRHYKKIFALLVCGIFIPVAAQAQTSAFTYQGKLTTGGSPASVPHDFIFKLFDLPAGPTQVGPDLTRDDVPVTAGSFTVNLDFGSSPFTSAAGNYLEIWVRLGTDTGAYTPLSPRQPITSSPFAIRTMSAASASSADGLSASCFMCVNDGNIFSIDGSKVTGTVASASTATTAGNVTGVVSIANGGTGSTTQTFVDTSTNQSIRGEKKFLGAVTGSFTGDGRGLANVPGTVRWESSDASVQAVRNRGYMAVAAVQVTITLPQSASLVIGDIVRVSGSGAGGWRIAQNADQSVLLVNSLRWTTREVNRPWQSIASSADGGKLAAVVSGGQIYTSTDSGVTWTPREGNRDWQTIASSADGSKLAAVVAFGQIYTSTDSGVTWAARESSRNWTSIASSADGSKLAAVARNRQIYTSTDSGETWTPRDSNRNWTSIASSVDGSKLAAVVALGQVYTSTDSGVTWAPTDANRDWRSVASSADGSKLAAVVAGGQIYTSADSGVTWAPTDANRDWRSIASSADGGKLAAVASGGQIYTSTDAGVGWTPSESNRSWTSIASAADGSKLAASVLNGQIFTSSLNTTPGTAGYMVGGQFTAIELQYIGNGQFIPISREGTITAF